MTLCGARQQRIALLFSVVWPGLTPKSCQWAGLSVATAVTRSDTRQTACLGCSLLPNAKGGEVNRSAYPEIRA